MGENLIPQRNNVFQSGHHQKRMIINSYRFAGAAGYLLDTYTGAEAAYSLRVLASAFETSDLITVRRGSDNSESGFTATEITDGTLVTWVGGGGNGFVVTCFDQSGNGKDAGNTNFSNQPSIVTAGVLQTSGGLPVMVMDGNSDALISEAGLGLVGTSGTIFNVFEHLFADDGGMAAVAGTIFIGISQTSGSSPDLNVGSPSYFVDGSEVVSATRTTLKAALDVTAPVMATVTGLDFSSSSSWSTSVFEVGRYPDAALTARQNFSEFIVYDSDESGNRSGIEANINAHYSI